MSSWLSETWRCWRCPKQSKMTQVKITPIEQSSFQSTRLIPLWEMYSKPGYFMVSWKHGAMQPRYLDFCQETIQEMVFHDCSPSLHPLIRCNLESSLIHWDGTVTSHWEVSVSETTAARNVLFCLLLVFACSSCSLFFYCGMFGRRSNGFSGLCKARESAWHCFEAGRLFRHELRRRLIV